MEVERHVKRRGVVWHGGVEVAENVGSCKGRVQFFFPKSRVFRSPCFDWEMRAQAIRRSRE